MSSDGSGGANADSAGGAADRYLLQGVARALRLLELLGDVDGAGLTVTEVSRQLPASKSAAFALLHTLTVHGYVAEVAPGPRYRLGPSVIRLGDRVTQGMPLIEICRPIMQELTAKTGWTSRVAVFDNGYPVFLDRVEGTGTIRFYTPLGQRELPHRSAAGKAMLATLPDDRIRSISEEAGLPRRTRHTITSIDDLLADIALCRQRGFAVDDEEGDDGVFCVGAAFLGRDHHCAGAVSITGLKVDIPSWQMHELGRTVREHADQMALGLGGRRWEPQG